MTRSNYARVKQCPVAWPRMIYVCGFLQDKGVLYRAFAAATCSRFCALAALRHPGSLCTLHAPPVRLKITLRRLKRGRLHFLNSRLRRYVFFQFSAFVHGTGILFSHAGDRRNCTPNVRSFFPALMSRNNSCGAHPRCVSRGDNISLKISTPV